MSKKPLNYKEIAIIKSYRNTDKLKMTICQKHNPHTLDKFRFVDKSKKGMVNDRKLDCNLSRAKNAVFELAMCNRWEYFGNFTISSQKHDRADLKGYYKEFSQWLQNYNKKHSLKIKYLFIPEKHKDGNWHIHGFITGIPLSHLVKFKRGDKTPDGKPIPSDLWKKGYHNWVDYMNKFGWCSLGIIENPEATAKYVTKYFTKDMMNAVSEVNAKSYYCSRGLKKATEVKRGYLAIPVKDADCDFVNDYVKIINFDKNNLSFVLSNIIPLEP
jgi:hypothetical protein